MKTQLKFSIIALSFVLFNCKNETKTTVDYKFSDKAAVITCANADSKLLNEALYAFEDDISKYYDKDKQNPIVAYNRFFKSAAPGRVKYEEIVSPHTMDVFEALKNNTDLWKNSSINYNSDIFSCLADNFKSKDLQTTFKALVSTNSMSTELFKAPLLPLVRTTKDDKYLALYMALDFYYKNLKDIDPATVTEKPAGESSVNSNPETKSISKALNKKKEESHEGHDH